MIVTNQMLEAALRKAVEAGLLPRDALRGESFGEREVIRHVLQAALNAGLSEAPPTAATLPFHRRPTRDRALDGQRPIHEITSSAAFPAPDKKGLTPKPAGYTVCAYSTQNGGQDGMRNA